MRDIYYAHARSNDTPRSRSGVVPEHRVPGNRSTMARYDEDLHENLFFNTLVSKYNILFTEAAERKWMVSFIALLPGVTTPGQGGN